MFTSRSRRCTNFIPVRTWSLSKFVDSWNHEFKIWWFKWWFRNPDSSPSAIQMLQLWLHHVYLSSFSIRHQIQFKGRHLSVTFDTHVEDSFVLITGDDWSIRTICKSDDHLVFSHAVARDTCKLWFIKIITYVIWFIRNVTFFTYIHFYYPISNIRILIIVKKACFDDLITISNICTIVTDKISSWITRNTTWKWNVSTMTRMNPLFRPTRTFFENLSQQRKCRFVLLYYW